MSSPVVKIKVNLATNMYSLSAAPYVVMAALVVVSVAYSVYNAFDYGVNRHRIGALEVMLSRSEDKAGVVEAGLLEQAVEYTKGREAEARKEVDFINDIIAEETFSWTLLLTAIEACLPSKASIVQLTPEFKEGKLTISGLARTKDDVLEFLDGLVDSEEFTDVFLLSHSEGEGFKSVSRRGEGERVFFEISAVFARGI